MPSAKEKAIELLARREHSQLELKKKLQLRGYEAEEIQSAIEVLLEKEYLDEARFLESYVRMRIAAGFGPIKIKKEVMLRGISIHALSDCQPWNDANWVELAQSLANKKYNMPVEDRSDYQRRARFLTGRGFTVDQIIQVLT